MNGPKERKIIIIILIVFGVIISAILAVSIWLYIRKQNEEKNNNSKNSGQTSNNFSSTQTSLAPGSIVLVAGEVDISGIPVDGAFPTSTRLNNPFSIFWSEFENTLYIFQNNLISRINYSLEQVVIRNIIGDGTSGCVSSASVCSSLGIPLPCNLDPNLPTFTILSSSGSVTEFGENSFLIADSGNNRILRYNTVINQQNPNQIEIWSGSNNCDPGTTGNLRSNALYTNPTFIVSNETNVFVSETQGSSGAIIRRITRSPNDGTVSNFCGGGTNPIQETPSPGLSVLIPSPIQSLIIVGDSLYFVAPFEIANASAIYQVSPTQNQGASQISLFYQNPDSQVFAACFHPTRNLWYISLDNFTIQSFDPSNPTQLTRVAGTPNVPGNSGDGGAALNATLQIATQITIDTDGNLLLLFPTSFTIRKVVL